jgi:hypothetical protein
MAFSLFTVPALRAQAAPAADASAPAAGDLKTDDATVVLSPFTVTTEGTEEGYTAKDTLAGTRIRTNLNDVASAISVVTSKFLQDTGAKNTQDLLVYTTNTEVSGVHGNYSGVGGSSTYNEAGNLLRPSNNTRVRGLDSADNTRDYFLSEIPWDSYNTGRIDMQRGPNSILFGVGSPSGIINASLNAAAFKNSGKVENRFDGEGSLRDSLDLNRVLVKDELAVRLSALDDNTKYQQKPAFNHDKRIYAALRYEPKLFGDDAHTSIRLNFENGTVSANRPRDLPPIDGITPWFQTGSSNGYPNLNKLTLNPLTSWNQYGNNPAYPGNTYPGLSSMARFFSADVASYYDANGTRLFSMTPATGTALGINESGVIDGTITGIEFNRPWGIATYNTYARSYIPGGKYYSNVSLSDPSIFDFYHKLIDGDNKHEWQRWNAENLAIQQTFFRDRLGFEFAYDRQRYEDGQEQFLANDTYMISVDINNTLLDGSPNPNVGRPYVSNSGQYGNTHNAIDRDSKRFTAFYDLRTEDFIGKSGLAAFLGHHMFTVLASQDEKMSDARNYARWASSVAYAQATGQSTDLTNGPRQFDWLAYLGPSLLGKSSAAGANLSNVGFTVSPNNPTNLRYFDSRWNAPAVDAAAPYVYYTHDTNGALVANTGVQADNPANYVGWSNGNYNTLNADAGDIGSLYTSGQQAFNRIKSIGFTWQGYFWNGDIVPVYGWRQDTVTNASSIATKDANGVARLGFRLDDSAANTRQVSGISRSWGLVIHTPKSLRRYLPLDSNISVFANHSENFKADAPRGDIFGNAIPNPEGTTKEYGVMISTLHDKLSLKIDHYETAVKNATLQADSAGFSSSLYYVWALPYWGATHALAALDGASNPQLRQGNWGWPWNNIAKLPDGSPDNARILQIAKSFFNQFPLDQHFADEYGLGMNVAAMRAAATPDQYYASVPTYGVNSAGVYDPVGGVGASNLGLQPLYGGNLASFGTGPVASVDTLSRGIEIELNAQPTPEWNLTFNASRTDASRTAISPAIVQWINLYTKFLAGDPGLLQLWGGDTFRKVWADQVLAPYNVLQAQIGSSAPEIARWRFNGVTGYNFTEGVLRGANIGLAYRWEGRRILGYKYDPTTDALDISQPWYGPVDDHVDLWVGYQHALTHHLDWRIQLNLRNVGESNHLTPVNIQPDGSVALSRIQEGMSWQLTNAITF